MKTQYSRKIRLAASAGALTILVAAGISGCGVSMGAGLTRPPQASAPSDPTIVTPQPGSREWNDANYGDSGL
jgi:hypothetical protein